MHYRVFGVNNGVLWCFAAAGGGGAGGDGVLGCIMGCIMGFWGALWGFWGAVQLQVGVELEVMGFWGALWGFGVHYGVLWCRTAAGGGGAGGEQSAAGLLGGVGLSVGAAAREPPLPR